MGGGGAVRAAAKIAGIRVASGARRGAGEGARPASAIVSSPAEEAKSAGVSAVSQTNVAIDAAAQRPSLELDDWEFAGGVEDDVASTKSSGKPMPRVVFGGAPTPQEAKEATDELKDALEKTYLTSPYSAESGDLLVPGHQYPLLLSKPDYLETKACVTSEETAISLPNGALKAFRLLNESPAAQNIVASLASDRNVWNAVLQNEALIEFLESQKSTDSFSKMHAAVEGSFADSEFTDSQSPKSAESADEFNGSGKSGDSGNSFMDFVNDIKVKVNVMMSSLSDYFQSLFGGPTGEKVSNNPFGDKAVGASVLGLVVMVIMVVVMKRV